MPKYIRISGLPASIQTKILALRDSGRKRAAQGPALRFVTQRQLERVLKAIDEVSLGERKGWEHTNQAVALGRVMLRYFEENPAAKVRFQRYTMNLQQTGFRVMDRKPPTPLAKSA